MKEEIPLKSHFPSIKGDRHILKDEIIANYPNIPSSTSNHLHEARTTKG
jgi:hypothetical protein